MRMLPDGLVRPAERIEGGTGIADGLGLEESFLLGSCSGRDSTFSIPDRRMGSSWRA